MTTIFCSNKLEKLVGEVESNLLPDQENKLGNWNGHSFVIDRKKNIIFTNDKTAYSFVWTDVRKADLKDFNSLFRESLIKQLYNDLKINETQEVGIRKLLTDIRLTKTNNNKRILGTINDFISLIKFEASRVGGLNNLTNISIGYGLNNHFIGTKLEVASKRYSIPKELMESLLQ